MPGSGQARTVRVPWAFSAVPGIRRTIVADLVVRGVSAEVIDEAEIVVSELVANALRHAHALPDGTVRVHWKVKNGAVEVEVSDGGGPTEPASRTPVDVGGRRPRPADRAQPRPRVGRAGGPRRPHRVGCPRRAVPAPQHLTVRAAPARVAAPDRVPRARPAPRGVPAGGHRGGTTRVTDHGQGIQAPYGES